MSFNVVRAVEYSFFANVLRPLILSSLQKHVVPLKGKYKKLLDLGSGTGQNTIFVADYFKADSVLGIDKNEDFVNFARSHAPSSKRHIYEVCDLTAKEDLQGILKKHAEIDLVTSFFLLHWIDDQISIFRTLHSAIKGPFEHVHLFPYNSYKHFYGLLDNLVESRRWKTYLQDRETLDFISCKEPNIFSDQFHEEFSNFKSKEIKEVKDKISFKFLTHEEDMMFLKLILPCTKRIPKEQHEEFLEDCWKELLKTCTLKDGTVPWSFNVYILYAQLR